MDTGDRLPPAPAVSRDPERVVVGDREISLDRVRTLIAALETELTAANLPQDDDIRKEIDTLKQMLASPAHRDEGRIDEKLHTIRHGLREMTARVEGEVLKDSPYIAEIGRILGLV